MGKRRGAGKKGMELSVNFLVVLILSIVIFSGGVAIFFKAFKQSTEQAAMLDKSTQMQIEAALDDGGLVAVPMANKEARKGDAADFGIGVSNEAGASYEFTLTVYYSAGDPPAPGREGDFSIAYTHDPVSIMNNERYIYPLRIRPEEAPKGTHIFNVAICYNGPDTGLTAYTCASGRLYAPLKKLYLSVR